MMENLNAEMEQLWGVDPFMAFGDSWSEDLTTACPLPEDGWVDPFPKLEFTTPTNGEPNCHPTQAHDRNTNDREVIYREISARPCRERAQSDAQSAREPKPPVLACPFYKLNPRKYHDCKGFVLRRIKDVKQHLNRKHLLPEFYCERCFNVFYSEKDRSEHVRGTQICHVRDGPPFQGVTREQREKLKQYLSRRKSVKDQWYDLWDIIFPGEQKPRNVYLDHCHAERILMLRSMWKARGQEITKEITDRTLETNPFSEEVKSQSTEMINQAMEKLLERVEAEVLGANGSGLSGDFSSEPETCIDHHTASPSRRLLCYPVTSGREYPSGESVGPSRRWTS